MAEFALFVVYFTADDALKKDMYSRVANTCLILLRSKDPLTNYCILLWMEENLPLLVTLKEFLVALSENSYLLSTLQSDHPCTIKLRLTCLTHVITDNNIQQIADNISAYLCRADISRHVADICVHFLSHDLLRLYSDTATNLLLDLMVSGSSATARSLLSVLLTFTNYDEDKVEILFSRLISTWRDMTEMELVTLLTLSTYHAYKSANYLTHMSDICEYTDGSISRSHKSQISTAVRCALLTALVECFKQQPVEYKDLLLQSLCHCGSGSEVVLQEHISWCHQQLRQLKVT